jgi:hypothetical protein
VEALSALAFDGTPNNTPVGYFTYTVDDDHWAWSDGLYGLHGYAPGEVSASTELMLQHKHPDDVARTLDVMEEVIRTGDAFSCYHRIVDARNRVRSVVSVGRGLMGPGGKVEQVTGFFVDLTKVRQDETQHEVEAALLKIAQTRLVIEQAKGVVMAVAGCDAEEAFAILRDASSRTNVKLNAVARALVERVAKNPLPHPHPQARDNIRRLLNSLPIGEASVRRQVS